MTALPKREYVSAEEYLVFERAAFEKHEYFDGEIFDMAGASDEHNTIGGNAYASLHFQLKKRPCKAY